VGQLWQRWVGYGLLALLVALVFGGSVRNAYVAWDDPSFVAGSPAVQHGLSWEGLRWAFEGNLTRADTTLEYWMPITALSRLIDAEFGGMRAGWVHGMSAFYHLLAAMAFWSALARLGMDRGRARVVAACFAVHPVQVEAVCWAAGRKDVLAGLFWALTLWAYAAYAQRRSRRGYLVVLALFVGALMAKPSVMMLPAVLLLVDHWPLRRFGRERFWFLVAEKVPLVLLTGLSLLTSVLAQVDHGGLKSLDQYPLWVRLGNGALAYAGYVGSFVWPSGLAPVYPHPGLAFPVVWAIAAGLALGAATATAWCFRGRVPWFFTGWLWFVCTLVPMSGLVQLGGAARADRYLYTAMVGLAIVAVEAGASIARQSGRGSSALRGAVVGVLAVWALLAARQVGYWRDTITLFERAVAVTGPNRIALNSLAVARLQAGDLEGARRDLVASLAMDDANPHAWLMLGRVLLLKGEAAEARWCFETSARLDGQPARAWYFAGVAAERAGDLEGALSAFAEAGRVAPEWGRPLLERARILDAKGEGEHAVRERAEAGRRKVGQGLDPLEQE